jgi:hypothetical protein
MIDKPVDQISEDDLLKLQENQVMESKTIEYKEKYSVDSYEDKLEFLADVSSFANASGGDIMYGIIADQATSAPKEIKGLKITEPDNIKNQLEHIIRSGVEPRIPSVSVQPISLKNSRTVILIRVKKSWMGPHGVKTKHRHYEFYSRHSTGKFSMDISEMRTAFTMADTLAERIRRFRDQRVANIIAGETPVALIEDAKIILHLVPYIAFTQGEAYDLEILALNKTKFLPMSGRGWFHRFNLDGYLAYDSPHNELSGSYIQFFKKGIIESVDVYILNENNSNGILSIHYERELIAFVARCIEILKSFDVELPIYLFLTLTGVKGRIMLTDKAAMHGYYDIYDIDRDVIFAPDVEIKSYDEPPDKILRPCFDAIWNACGYPRSFNYDYEGNWKK